MDTVAAYHLHGSLAKTQYLNNSEQNHSSFAIRDVPTTAHVYESNEALEPTAAQVSRILPTSTSPPNFDYCVALGRSPLHGNEWIFLAE